MERTERQRHCAFLTTLILIILLWSPISKIYWERCLGFGACWCDATHGWIRSDCPRYPTLSIWVSEYGRSLSLTVPAYCCLSHQSLTYEQLLDSPFLNQLNLLCMFVPPHPITFLSYFLHIFTRSISYFILIFITKQLSKKFYRW